MFLSFSAYAENNSEAVIFDEDEQLGLVQDVRLIISDQVEDGCWTNIDTVKNKTKLTLEQSHIPVKKEDNWNINILHPRLVITAAGFKSNDFICAGQVSVELWVYVSQHYGNLEDTKIRKYYLQDFRAIPFSRTSLFTSGENLNEQIKDFVDSEISNLASKIIAGRRSPKVKRFLDELQK